LFSFQVHGVLFASDYLYLFEDEEAVSDNKVIVMFQPLDNDIKLFQEIYSNGVFEWSQVEKGNLSFYVMNNTDLLHYPDWLAYNEDDSATYEMYIDHYINQQINSSLYNITITLPDPEDTTTHGDIIGSYRYFNIDLLSGSLELIKVEVPKTPGFELLFILFAITFVYLLKKKNER
jgi:hypothetical protein